MAPLLAMLVGLSFVVLYKNIVDTKRVRHYVTRPNQPQRWHHTLGMAALVLNVPQLINASMHPNVVYAFGGLLVLGIWLGIKHRSEGLYTKL